MSTTTTESDTLEVAQCEELETAWAEFNDSRSTVGDEAFREVVTTVTIAACIVAVPSGLLTLGAMIVGSDAITALGGLAFVFGVALFFGSFMYAEHRRELAESAFYSKRVVVRCPSCFYFLPSDLKWQCMSCESINGGEGGHCYHTKCSHCTIRPDAVVCPRCNVVIRMTGENLIYIATIVKQGGKE